MISIELDMMSIICIRNVVSVVRCNELVVYKRIIIKIFLLKELISNIY